LIAGRAPQRPLDLGLSCQQRIRARAFDRMAVAKIGDGLPVPDFVEQRYRTASTAPWRPTDWPRRPS